MKNYNVEWSFTFCVMEKFGIGTKCFNDAKVIELEEICKLNSDISFNYSSVFLSVLPLMRIYNLFLPN